jgi:hypothetical protein
MTKKANQDTKKMSKGTGHMQESETPQKNSHNFTI